MANAKAFGLVVLGLLALPALAGCPLPDARPQEEDGGTTNPTTGTGGEGGRGVSASHGAGAQGGVGIAASSSGSGGAGGGCAMPSGCGGPGCPPCGSIALLATGALGGITGKFVAEKGWSTSPTLETGSDVPALAFTDAGVGVGMLRASDKLDQLRFAVWMSEGFGAFSGVGPGISAQAAPSAVGAPDGIHVAYLGTDGKHYYASYKAGWMPSAEPVLANNVHSVGTTPAALAVRGDEVVLAYMGSDGKLYDQARKANMWAPAGAHGSGALSGPPALVSLASGPEYLAVFSVQPKGPLQWMTRSLGIWTAPAPIAGTPAAEPALVALPSGAAVLVYRDLESDALSWARFEAGTWSAPKPVASQPLAYASSRPALAPGVVDAEVELAFVDPLGTAFHCRLQGDAFSAPASVGGTALKVVAIAKSP
ncbi:hypothetical protein [Polyangium aurulentum]|uniref:hypothetical protein n=1 Tax=Polyangium aurulentum TaxID=2567896 RepID=UPI0010ADCD55|nr:hypothetical protein [Polyangium aurulentum]UQA59686.1 hypothetical protein E8A73_004055 [Polyangium aurulentum]